MWAEQVLFQFKIILKNNNYYILDILKFIYLQKYKLKKLIHSTPIYSLDSKAKMEHKKRPPFFRKKAFYFI